jgi:D-3-phosphoglycerate dehydrogenase / 2-oxoglutarate reductase
MTKHKKQIVAVLEPGYANYETEQAILDEIGARIIPVKIDEDPVQVLKGNSPSALMVRERIVSKDLLNAFPDVKVIVRYGVGIDNIDIDFASQRKIFVANVPDYGADQEVSDHAIALYLAISRRIVTRDQQVKKGAWGVGQNEIIYGRKGSTLGLIGFGAIARQAWIKFNAMGFKRALVTDPALSQEEVDRFGVEITDLMTICRESDVISLHSNLTPETHHIINQERLSVMKPSTILVNVGRGELIEEAALIAALNNGRIFGAGLDVFEQEPPNLENPLFKMSNVIVSDHTAWYSEATVKTLQTKGASQVLMGLKGEAPKNWVNPW